MGKRGARRQDDRFLWAGVVILLLSAALGVYAAAGGDSTVLGIALAAFGLCAAILLLLFRSHLLAAEQAVEILAESVRSREPAEPEGRAVRSASNSSRKTHSRLPDAEKGEDSISGLMEDRLSQISSAHQDLLAHHRFTKRMLQSLRHEEVLEILLQGIREGLGFPGAMLGIRDPEGILRFRGTPMRNGGEAPGVAVAGWDDASLVGRIFWSGSSLLVPSLHEYPHTETDRQLLGDGRSLLVSVCRKGNRKCSEVRNCMNLACPVHGVEGARCWIEGKPGPASDRTDPQEQRKRECVQCDMFAACGMIVVQERRDARPLTRETTRVIVSLADEAGLALQMAKLYEEARILAVTDGLTGLTNHREFYVSLRRELERARRYSHAVSLLMIDVDNFKEFNDRFGHMKGDEALRAIAGILKRCVRASDIVARYGGEEFGIILPESTPVGAQMLAERIKTEIASHEFVAGPAGRLGLTVSIGIYTSLEGADSEDQMVGFADEAAYIAKSSGKNQVVVKAHA
ncbi:MAG: hypothetical protein Kow00128_10730 [Deltaproteobacteria bacterium]